MSDNTVSGSAEKLEGMDTIWEFNTDEPTEVNISCNLTVTSGKAKLVYIDPDGTVTTIAECIAGEENEQSVSESIKAEEGENRIRLVGAEDLLLGHIPEHASEADAPRGLAAPEHLARIRRQRASDDADQRALARAVRAKKAVEAGGEGEGDAGEGLLFAGVRVDLFTERRPTGRSLCVSFFEAVDG